MGINRVRRPRLTGKSRIVVSGPKEGGVFRFVPFSTCTDGTSQTTVDGSYLGIRVEAGTSFVRLIIEAALSASSGYRARLSEGMSDRLSILWALDNACHGLHQPQRDAKISWVNHYDILK